MKLSNLIPVAVAGLATAQSSVPSLTDLLSSNNSTLSTLSTVLRGDSSLLRTLERARNVTILAPSNEALEKVANTSAGAALLRNPGAVAALLQYHVLNGTFYASNITENATFVHTHLTNSSYTNVTNGQVVEALKDGDTVSFYSGLRAESNVTKADLNFTGGVVHVINEVLTLPKNISDTAIAAGLSAFAGAVDARDLTTTIDGLRNITVFAPNNAAFAAIGSAIGNLSNDDLDSILEYHIVSGSVAYSTDLSDGDTFKSLEGEDLNISEEDGDFYVNGARVVTPDILINNGVLHVVDGVLNPDNSDATANPSTTTAAFSGASSASSVGVPFTSGVPSATERVTGIETGIETSSSTEAGAHATAAVAFGALFGGAAVMMNM